MKDFLLSIRRRVYRALPERLQGLVGWFYALPSTFMARSKAYRMDPWAARFIAHNKKVWSAKTGNDGEVLVEIFQCATSIAAFSHLAQYLARDMNASISAYFTRKRFWEESFLDTALARIYLSFANRIFHVNSDEEDRELDDLLSSVLAKLQSKEDLFKLTLDGIRLGDLFYDSILRTYNVPTVDMHAPMLAKSLRTGLMGWLYWKRYLKAHKVRAIVVSHTVYQQFGVLPRLALSAGIPVFQANSDSLYRFSAQRPDAYLEFLDYPELFQRIPVDARSTGIARAAQSLERRISGEVGVDMLYSSRSAFATPSGERVLEASNRKKILIAPHCFFDNPNNTFGGHLFVDFYEWIDFLGRVSEKTDYDWYIKTHPDVLPGNDEVLKAFQDRYPRFRLLPASTSHKQIIADGIDVALTVYGTIGIEYPYLGIPVINASRFNPRIRYDFNIHPESVAHYEELLINLDKLGPVRERDKIAEFYYMNRLRRPDFWLIDNLMKQIEDSGQRQNVQCGPWGYEAFLAQATPERHDAIQATVRRFVESGEYFLAVEQISPVSNSAVPVVT
ncbi:MAG: hypothetical protein K8S54_13615 [Spirochaetia bacterium]|nr:hypothetical protein [Spirochaetia bacterium]